ncbi:MAG: helix-hairpin-helix domain-containing protein [Burkholderiaceae bacterium]
MKASQASQATVLEDIPNIGPALAGVLRLIGISQPQQLQGRDGYALYQSLNRVTRQRHDPCVLDAFMAAVDFMNGGAATPWWKYTPARKTLYRDI